MPASAEPARGLVPSTGGIVRFALGGVLVWLAFRRTAWDEVLAAIGAVHLLPLLGAFVTAACTQLVRVQRSVYIIRASTPAPYAPICSSGLISIFLNVALPLRVGDAARAFVLSKDLGIRVPKALSMVVVDRIADLIGLLLLAGFVLAVLPSDLPVRFLPVSGAVLRPVAWTGLALIVGILAILVWMYVSAPRFLAMVDVLTRPLTSELRSRIHVAVYELADGLHVFRAPGDIAKTLGFAILAWLGGCLMLHLVMTSFELHPSWYAPMLMQIMVAAFVVVPLVPGLVGQFHLAIVTCLLMTVPEIRLPEAKAVAVLAHLAAVLPVTILGGAALIRERLDIRSVTTPSD